MSTSIAAQLLGYLSFEEQSQIRGVILNRISKGLYPEIKELIESRIYKHHRLRIYAEDAGLFAGKQTSWACDRR